MRLGLFLPWLVLGISRIALAQAEPTHDVHDLGTVAGVRAKLTVARSASACDDSWIVLELEKLVGPSSPRIELELRRDRRWERLTLASSGWGPFLPKQSRHDRGPSAFGAAFLADVRQPGSQRLEITLIGDDNVHGAEKSPPLVVDVEWDPSGKPCLDRATVQLREPPAEREVASLLDETLRDEAACDRLSVDDLLEGWERRMAMRRGPTDVTSIARCLSRRHDADSRIHAWLADSLARGDASAVQALADVPELWSEMLRAPLERFAMARPKSPAADVLDRHRRHPESTRWMPPPVARPVADWTAKPGPRTGCTARELFADGDGIAVNCPLWRAKLCFDAAGHSRECLTKGAPRAPEFDETVGVAGDVVVSFDDQVLAGRDRSSGQTRWSVPHRDSRNVVMQDGVVYSATWEGPCAFDARTGEIRWFSLPVPGSPVAVLVWGDVLVYRDGDGTLRAVRPSDREILWSWEAHPVTPPIVVGDRLYVLDQSATLHALRLPS